MSDRLRIIAVDDKEPSVKSKSTRTARAEIQARFDRLWHQNPQQFDPSRNCAERERLDRTMRLINHHLFLEGMKVADLGCGAGDLSIRISQGGAAVDAVDISTIPLNMLDKKRCSRVNAIQDCLPSTLLKEENYDLILCTEVIAYLAEREHRLLLNELSRIVKKAGYVVCSTAIDVYSEDALQKFASLANTELQILDWTFSFHRLFISLRNLLGAPERFLKASLDQHYRQQQLDARRAVGKWWFKVNCFPLIASLWRLVCPVFSFLDNYVKQSRTLMLALEKISRFLFSESGISHVIFIANRRPLAMPLEERSEVFERKQKKSVWE